MPSLLKKFKLAILIDFIATNRNRNIIKLIKLQNEITTEPIELDEYILNCVGVTLCLYRTELLDEDSNFENFDVSESSEGNITVISPLRQNGYLEYLKDSMMIREDLFTTADKQNLDSIIKIIKDFSEHNLQEISSEKPYRNEEVRNEFLAQIPLHSKYFVLENSHQLTSFFIHWNDWVDFLNFLKTSKDCEMFLGDVQRFLMNTNVTMGESWFMASCSKRHPDFRIISEYLNFQSFTITVKQKNFEGKFLKDDFMEIEVLAPEDRLSFGKNEGLTLLEVYHHQPSYLEWAILNIPSFKIDIGAFEKLPNPRPLDYKRENFTEKGLAKGLSVKEWLKTKDMSNQFVSVEEIKEFEVQNNITPKEIEYKFPENIRQINNAK